MAASVSSETWGAFVANEKVCPQCGTRYEADHMFCFLDGAALIQATNSTDLVGSIIADRYRVVSKLGDGGMGQVFLAEHVRMKRRCAVKVMRPQLMSDPVAVVRFNREAENASQISHPNVCAVYDFGETANGLIYLAMEFIDGEPLSRTLEQEVSLIPVRAADIISQTADALSAAHGLGILHRDLKPDNIMIAKSRAGTDHVKIVDFGIARVMAKESQQLTSTGIAVGTPEYMSPEQFAGDTLDARTDIYSLALVGYHALTGAHAFGSGSTTDHLLARLTQPPRRLSIVKPDVAWPDALQKVFDKALAADPAQRYSDVLDFARDFTEAVTELPVTTTEEHYLSAIATRRLTPPRTFTPARGVPTLDVPITGARDESASAPATATASEWIDSGAAVALTTPSQEQPTEQIPPAVLPGAPSGGTVDRTIPPGDTGEVAVGTYDDSDEPTVSVPGLDTVPRRKSRAGLLVGGGVLVAAVAGFALFMRPSSAPTPEPVAPPPVAQAPAPVVPTVDSTVAPATPVESTTVAPAAIGATASGLALDSAVTRMRPGVVGVLSTEGRGTGFLADTARGTGLVVTSSALVPSDSIIDVQVDGATRIRGRVAASDRTAGVAVVAVALQPWQGYRVLAVGGDTLVKAGDSLVALGSSFTSSARRGAARAGDDGKSRPALSITRADAGRPIVSAAPSVVALATQRGGQSTFAMAPAIDATVRAAKTRVGRDGFTAPSPTVLPAWPAPAYPAEATRESARKDTIDLTPYRASAQGYRVLAMTPPVIAWRDSAIARTKAYWDSPFQLNKYPYALMDPIQAWTGLRPTVSERRPVIVLSVVPDGVPLLKYKTFPDVSDPKSDRTEVRSARLLRDGQQIVALDSARFAAVVNPKDYQDRKRPVRDERLLVFRLDDFAKTGAYSVEIAGGGRPVNLVLPQALLDAVRRDAARWRSAR